jgi:hypothetical protein
MLTIGEYDKFLATLVRPPLAVLLPRAVPSSGAARFPAEGATIASADRWQ